MNTCRVSKNGSVPQPDFGQLFLEVVPGDEGHIIHGGVLGWLLARGNPLKHHARGVIALNMRAWQHRTEKSAVGFFQLADRVRPIDPDTDHVGRRETGTFSGAHTSEHGVVIHPADDQVFRFARQLDQRRIGGVHAAGNVEGLEGGE